jgi:hypothetical protein
MYPIICTLLCFHGVNDTLTHASSNLRGISTITALVFNLLFMVLDRVYTDSSDRNKRYGLIVMTQIFYFIPHSLNVAWMALTARDGEERAVAMAM